MPVEWYLDDVSCIVASPTFAIDEMEPKDPALFQAFLRYANEVVRLFLKLASSAIIF
jgi:hypothetical protein